MKHNVERIEALLQHPDSNFVKSELEKIDEDGYTALTFIADKVDTNTFTLLARVIGFVDKLQPDGRGKTAVEYSYNKVQQMLFLAVQHQMPVPQTFMDSTDFRSRNTRGALKSSTGVLISPSSSFADISPSGSSASINVTTAEMGLFGEQNNPKTGDKRTPSSSSQPVENKRPKPDEPVDIPRRSSGK